MQMQHVDRRHVLTAAGAGLALAAGLGGTAAAAPSSSERGDALTGGWLVTRHDKGTPGRIRGVITFADGGAFVGLDIEPTAPPYLGSWHAEHDNGFVAVFWTAITDPSGSSIGTARIRATGSVHGDKISGSYTAVIFIGNQQQHPSGTFRGTRIEAD